MPLQGDAVVGAATTDDNGEAVLADVSVSGMLPGHFSDTVTVRFAGDAADLPGSGSAALDILPARDVTQEVRVHREIEDSPPGTSVVELEVTNRRSSEALTGLFAIQLNNVTPAVTLRIGDGHRPRPGLRSDSHVRRGR
jgi:hypothetical protein